MIRRLSVEKIKAGRQALESQIKNRKSKMQSYGTD
jgi:hypothetical protein